MQALYQGIRHYLSPVAQNAVTPAPAQSSKNVISAEKEIDRALLMFETERYEEVIEICKDLHTNAVETCSVDDIKDIKNKLFEASLEISLAGNNKIAREILNIVDSPTNPDMISTWGIIYHREANACWAALSSHTLLGDSRVMETVLKKAITENEHLKSAAQFVGNVHQNGLYRVSKDEAEAQKFFQIAAARGFDPRSLSIKKQGEEYKLMLKAQKDNRSVFSHLPPELVNHIARLRFEKSLVKSTLATKPKSETK